jgi:hypothetical protein
MKTYRTCLAISAALLATLPLVAQANDFPTVARVLYVQECIRNNPGPNFEMVNKCSCALDRFAENISYDEYTELSTIFNAMTIGGERGNDLRDNDSLKPKLKRYREMQAKSQAACFIQARN